ncbi:MAG: hypothetical protein DMG26_21430, partial [Acidobacteria bacterium]
MMIQSSGRVWRVRVSPLVLALTLLFAGPEDFEGRGRPHGIPLAKALSEDAGVPLGFSPQTWFEVEQRLEQRYLKIPSPARCRRFLRRLTAEPHVAGTPGDRRVTQFIYDEFKRDGL